MTIGHTFYRKVRDYSHNASVVPFPLLSYILRNDGSMAGTPRANRLSCITLSYAHLDDTSMARGLHTRAELLGILALCLILELSPEGVGNPESDVATIRDIVDEHVVVWGGEGSLVAGGDEVVCAEG